MQLFKSLAATFALMRITTAPIPSPQPKATRRFPGDGVRRAEARLAAKRKANTLIPDCPIETRQRRRAEERARAKAYRLVLKREAMKNKLPGGAAVIR
ncbi:hypothetical protein [Oceanicola sp. S124]|uniref:hypothetical protein n=1 Tax=Oceanicola sp. S124 TaxID=1042378 RepID=UPI000255A6B1|nr:hypothetical protein [Oceanicola sp. S124]